MQSRPEVWDCNSVQFRNKLIKNRARRDIAQILGLTGIVLYNIFIVYYMYVDLNPYFLHVVEECMTTLKKLRDRYTRAKRLLPSGSEGGRRVWDKEKFLRFLDKVLVTRK